MSSVGDVFSPKLSASVRHAASDWPNAFSCVGEINLLHENTGDESTQCAQIDGAMKAVLKPWSPWVVARTGLTDIGHETKSACALMTKRHESPTVLALTQHDTPTSRTSEARSCLLRRAPLKRVGSRA